MICSRTRDTPGAARGTTCASIPRTRPDTSCSWSATDLVIDTDALWYKDAIIYQLHIKSYRDSNADGFGDFRGLIEKLDYVEQLGANTIWLLPFYPSPLKDDGYDIG